MKVIMIEKDLFKYVNGVRTKPLETETRFKECLKSDSKGKN